jgi:hypothetical protein
VLAVAWTVFGVPHLVYHLGHLDGFGTGDKVGNVVGLGGALLVAVALLLGSARARKEHG